MNSPKFDYFDYEPILEWAEAKVIYSDEFVDCSDGSIEHKPEWGSWTLCWKEGVMRLDYSKPEEQKARKCAALFIYLWTRGVECSIAISCARLYADNVSIKRL
jgi:hypothetical protein